jgi:ubiquinone/menaquinone biosynthesis C-methylase UbiE
MWDAGKDFLRGYESYLGVDISEVALRTASKRADAKTAFVQGEAESFVPEGEFDAIIFSECLYCFAEPLQVARQYERLLRGDGVMVVSLFVKTEKVKRLAEELSRRYEVVRRAVVKNERGSWECFLLRKIREKG